VCIEIIAGMKIFFFIGMLLTFPLIFLSYALRKQGQTFDQGVLMINTSSNVFKNVVEICGWGIQTGMQFVMRYPIAVFFVCFIGFLVSGFSLSLC
jgi:hypothetical protein